MKSSRVFSQPQTAIKCSILACLMVFTATSASIARDVLLTRRRAKVRQLGTRQRHRVRTQWQQAPLVRTANDNYGNNARLKAHYREGFVNGVLFAVESGNDGGILCSFSQSDAEKANSDGFDKGRFLIGRTIGAIGNWRTKTCKYRSRIIANILEGSAEVPAGIAKQITDLLQREPTPEEKDARSIVAKLGGEVYPCCGKVEAVTLRGRKFGNEEIKAILKLTDLTQLMLHGTSATDDSLKQLQTLPRLDTLILVNGRFTDAGMRHVAQSQKIETLVVNDVPVTDAGIQHLHEMKGLRVLNIRGTRTTDEGAKKLQETLPECIIGWERIVFGRTSELDGQLD